MDNLPKDYLTACRFVMISDPKSGNKYNKKEQITKAVDINNENYADAPYIGKKNHTFTLDGVSFPVAEGVIIPKVEHLKKEIDFAQLLIDNQKNTKNKTDLVKEGFIAKNTGLKKKEKTESDIDKKLIESQNQLREQAKEIAKLKELIKDVPVSSKGKEPVKEVIEPEKVETKDNNKKTE